MNISIDDFVLWAKNHAKGLASSADEELEDRITLAIIDQNDSRKQRNPLLRKRILVISHE